MKTIYIDGEVGTTGLQIRNLLALVPNIELLTLPKEKRRNVVEKRRIMAEADAVILCLPDDAARETVELIGTLPDRRPKILDASSAHRVTDGWVFGLPELGPDQRQAICDAEKVSNPGCYPTGAILLLKPLIATGIIPNNYPVCVYGISGYSGGGNRMIEEFESGIAQPYQLYGLNLCHKHIPELQAYAGLTRRPIFLPSVASFRQGIIDVIPVHLDLLPRPCTKEAFFNCLVNSYSDSPYVRVVRSDDEDRLAPDSLNGTNLIELRVHGEDSLKQVVLTARFDNLGKGAAGAAVQNLGLMLSLDVRAVLGVANSEP